MSWEDVLKYKEPKYVKRLGRNKREPPKSPSVYTKRERLRDRQTLEKIVEELDKAVEMHTSQAKRIREIIGDLE